MAAIIRVKRKREEDPAEALILACKRRRDVEEDAVAAASEITEVLKFAGTTNSRDVSVSSKIRDAIRKEKLQKEYKQYNPDVAAKARRNAATSSCKNRYQVIESRRAIHLDHLDEAESPEKGIEKSEELSKLGLSVQSFDDKNSGSESSDLLSCKKDSEPIDDIRVEKITDQRKQKTQEKVFCLYDVENVPPNPSDVTEELTVDVNSELSQVTCNSVPMIRERRNQPQLTGHGEYVYDLYYTNRDGFDFRALETILRIEAYGEDVYDDYRDNSEDVYEDEDDSNDEGNWRNDYPDQDPLYYENADEDFLYEDDMNQNHLMLGEGYGLEDYMASHCNLGEEEDLSSDDDFDPYSGPQVYRSRPYSTYLKEIKKELGENDT